MVPLEQLLILQRHLQQVTAESRAWEKAFFDTCGDIIRDLDRQAGIQPFEVPRTKHAVRAVDTPTADDLAWADTHIAGDERTLDKRLAQAFVEAQDIDAQALRNISLTGGELP